MSCEPPRKVRIVRCPECGSTDAGSDESRSFIDLTYMQCGECGYGDLVDTWQIQFDWNVETELVGDELPEYVEPLAPGADIASSISRAREAKERSE